MKRFWLFLTIVFLSQAVCFAGGDKPKKITKLIYFEGSVDKKKPIGHGKLILDRCVKNENANYHIEGDFSDDKITNAVFYINGEQTKGIINGDFGYAIDEKESTVTLTLNNVTFSCSYIINGKDKYYRHNDDLEHLFLGTVVIGKDRGSNGKGMGFIQDYYLSNRVDLPFDEYPKVLNPLISSPQCTREGLVYVKCEKGNGFFYVENTQFKSKNFKFKNGATYIPTDDESGVLEKPGSDVLQVKLFDKLILLKKNSVIQLKDKSTLKITDMKIPNDFDKNTKRGKWDVEVDGEITFTDGSKYNGTLLLSQLSCGQDGWGMTVYNYFKNIASKDLFLFYGKLVSSQGTVTEYIQNKTREEFKAENEARLLAEAKAQAEAEAEKARKEEQERASGHNGMTTEMLQSGNRSQQSFVNHIYYGVMHSNAEEYMEAMMSIHFLSNNTCRMKLTTKVKGSDDIPTLQIVQMMLEAQGENEKEDVFEYIFRNGTIIFKNTTDRFKVLNGGKELRWYIESNDKLAKKFYAILKRIK